VLLISTQHKKEKTLRKCFIFYRFFLYCFSSFLYLKTFWFFNIYKKYAAKSKKIGES
jgi:hypothetical protein